MDWTDYFYYDESSPTYLRWKVDVYTGRNLSILKIKAGSVAGSFSKTIGYYVVGKGGKQYLIHRVIFEMHNGQLSDNEVVDHIDGVPTNNALSNLNLTTQLGNMRNQKLFSTNTSGVGGVSYDLKSGQGYWCACWCENGRVRKRAFSLKKFGEEAFKMACDFRFSKLEEIGGYTKRHGT
jgi:hypothetical protein